MSGDKHSFEWAIGLLRKFSAEVDRAVLASCVARLQGRIGPELLRRTKAKVPVLFGRLRDSGYVRALPNGVEVGFGGGRVTYAGIVHERGPRPHSYKYVYDYEGLTASRVGEWNPKNIPPWYTRLFGRSIEWEGEQYRFVTVAYNQRHGSAGFPVTGQAHFLFGAPNSALEESRAEIKAALQEEAMRATAEALGKAVEGGTGPTSAPSAPSGGPTPVAPSAKPEALVGKPAPAPPVPAPKVGPPSAVPAWVTSAIAALPPGLDPGDLPGLADWAIVQGFTTAIAGGPAAMGAAQAAARARLIGKGVKVP